MSSEQKAEEARQQKAENEIVAALAAHGRAESEHRGGTVLIATVGLVLKKVKRAILLAKLAQAERSLALHDSDEVYPGMTTGEALTAERDRLRREVEEAGR